MACLAHKMKTKKIGIGFHKEWNREVMEKEILFHCLVYKNGIQNE